MNPITAWLLLGATWSTGVTQMLIDLAEGWDGLGEPEDIRPLVKETLIQQ